MPTRLSTPASRSRSCPCRQGLDRCVNGPSDATRATRQSGSELLAAVQVHPSLEPMSYTTTATCCRALSCGHVRVRTEHAFSPVNRAADRRRGFSPATICRASRSPRRTDAVVVRAGTEIPPSRCAPTGTISSRRSVLLDLRDDVPGRVRGDRIVDLEPHRSRRGQPEQPFGVLPPASLDGAIRVAVEQSTRAAGFGNTARRCLAASSIGRC